MSGEIITVEQMRAIDAASANHGVSTRTLMERAGRAIAEAVQQRFAPQPTAVLCGPGNNGGDGWVAARVLRELGWPVWVETAHPAGLLHGDAADAAAAWQGEVMPLGARTSEASLIIDALFGAGFSRGLEGETARLVGMLKGLKVVAVDVPSGLCGNRAAPIGEAHVQALLTVTFGLKKPVHVLEPGKSLCGEIVVADIGIPHAAIEEQHIALWENSPALWRMPWPDVQAHKHQRGHVSVASGGRARTGAARLAAGAALRSGAGLVTMLSPAEALDENAGHLTAIMLKSADDGHAFAAAAMASQCFVIGPAFGTSPAHFSLLDAALGVPARCPFVLDADALTLLAPLSARLGAQDVLTPHVGEFRRVFPGVLSASLNRIEAARAAAAYAGCTILLKGPDTIIARADGRAVVNTTGSPFLATAGSGDVLAGVIAGLIAQGMDSFEAACAGAWIHGRAGAVLGPGLISEDISPIIPRVLNELSGSTH